MEEKYSNIIEYLVKGVYPYHYNSKNMKRSFWRMAKTYSVEDGSFFYRNRQVVLSETATKVFKEEHSNTHRAFLATHEMQSKYYYWPAMSVDLRKWIQQCECDFTPAKEDDADDPGPPEKRIRESTASPGRLTFNSF